jgi:hypothetical protein
MLMTWILVAYLASYPGGGPLAIAFEDQAACESAAKTIKEKSWLFYKEHVCVPYALASRS